LADPKYTDKDRYRSGYATSQQSREPGYLQKRFSEIAERQRQELAARLKNVIANRRFK
jgi:hypothetical protein